MSTLKSSAEDLTLNADGSGNDIKFQSDGSEVASIDQAGTITATNFTGTGGNLTVKSDGTTPAIILRDSDDNIDGMFKALNGTVGMQTGTSGDWALLATNNAEISLYHDNAVKLATSALGVTVTGGVSLGGTTGANTLDDYETGTWTPTLISANDDATVSGGSYYGRYVKIGRQVTLTFWIVSVTVGAEGSGNARIGGVPFTPPSAAFNQFGSIHHVGGGFTTTPDAVYARNNETVLQLVSGAGTQTTLGTGTANYVLGGTFVYQITA